MEQDIISLSSNSNDAKEQIISQETPRIPTPNKENNEIGLEEHVLNDFQKNLPNVNAPEKIIICLDVCYDDPNSMYRFGDGTTFTPLNMLKRLLDFFIQSKYAINKSTEFALIILKDNEPHFSQSFTNDIKDIISAIDDAENEESSNENYDIQKIFELIEKDIVLPEYEEFEQPPYVVRLLMLYARSNCIPIIREKATQYHYLRKHPYFYIDILFAHEEDCALYKCEEVYDALQDLDNGYSYVFEVSRNATKIHDCIAKLLAHPLQRPLQKNTDYSFI